MPVTFYSYEDASDIAESVQELVKLMKRPLRGLQKLASVPSMTPLALAQLQRIPDGNNDADTSTLDDSLDKISSVANLVLSTSRAIEESVDKGFEARPTISHWYTLLRTVARNCHPDARVMGDVSFIYPQGFDGESGESTMLVGFSADESFISDNLDEQEIPGSDTVVPLCIAHHLGLATDQMSLSESGVGENESTVDEVKDEPDREDSNDDTDSDGDTEETDEDADEEIEYSDQDESNRTDDSSYDEGRDHPIYTNVPRYRTPPCLDEAEVFFGLDLVDEHEPPEEPRLDLPLEAHILAERRTWPSVLFPVLCIASEDEIIPLMASSAYQRHAWSIDLPIVGFEISSFGSMVRVHIAWVDPTSDVELPAVRILRPSSDVCAFTSEALSSQGIFDLAAPQSALELASFMFSLGHQFDALRHELPSRRLRKLRWRADNDTATWSESILEWRLSIDTPDQTKLYAHSSANSSSSPITPSSDVDSLDMPPKKDQGPRVSAKASKQLKPPKSTTKSASRESQGSDDQSRSTAKTAKAKSAATGSAPSMSPSLATYTETHVLRRFAEATGGSVDQDSTTASWMLHRYVSTVARFVPTGDPKESEPPELREMIKSYDEASCFMWPAAWTELERLPQVDSCLMSYRDMLFNERNDLQKNAPVLSEHFAEIMGSRLSLLLKSVDGARNKTTRPNGVREAESRHDFDALFNNFFVSEVEHVTSSEVFFECSLRLPLNTLREGLKGDQHLDYANKLHVSLTNWGSHEQALCVEFVNRTPQNAEPVLHEQATQAQAAITKMALDLSKVHKQHGSIELLRSRVESQYALEPSVGICDAVLVTVIPFPTLTPEAFAAYNNSRFVTANYKPALLKAVRLPSEPTLDDSDKKFSTRTSKKASPFPQYDFPLQVQSGDYRPFELRLESTMPPIPYIILPQLIVEYKKPADTEIKALNQTRIYDISNVLYLDSLGISSYPVFSLAVHGTRAALIMGWKAQNGVTYVMERNVQKFDILQPIQAFHLATVVLRLKAREKELRDRFETDGGAYRAKLAQGRCDEWAMPPKNERILAASTPPPPSTPAASTLDTVHEAQDELRPSSEDGSATLIESMVKLSVDK